MSNNRDNFPSSVIETLKKRAAYICSNPDCNVMTVGPSQLNDEQIVYIWRAAHICAASKNWPRYEESMTEDERSWLNNAIFLCSNCADMIDDNKWIDFSISKLQEWKSEHEKWVRENLNKKMKNNSQTTIINNITSHNQSWGITAHTVNIGVEQRTLTEELIKGLWTLISKDDEISVWATSGNLESIIFGREIFKWLNTHGYKTKFDDIIEVQSWPTQIWQEIWRDPSNLNQVEIRIGING